MSRYFSDIEVEYLKTNYPRTKTRELAGIMMCSERRISEKAWKLGLKKTKEARVPKFEFRLDDKERGYIAGLIDGDGTISVAINTHQTYIIPTVTIVSISRKFLEEVHTRLVRNLRIRKGIYISEFKQKGKGRNKIYRLQLKGPCVYPFLNEIKDHLILKRQQARLVQEFMESRFSRFNRTAPYTIEERNIIKEIRKQNERRIGKYD